MTKIKWINQSPGAAADERGYWNSACGRFEINPNYRHTIYPDSYTLTDRQTGKVYKSNDTIREAKARAARYAAL